VLPLAPNGQCCHQHQMDSVANSAKWTVLSLAPNECQEAKKKNLVECGGASVLLGYDAASLNNRFPTFRKDRSAFSFSRIFFPPDLKFAVLQDVGKRFPSDAAPFRESKKPLSKFQINSTLYSCIIRVHRRVSTCSHSAIFRTGTQKHVRCFLCYSHRLWKSVASVLCFVDRAYL